MEALQLAQMLADLNDLQASQDQGAAKALVTANRNLDKTGTPQQPLTSVPGSLPQSRPGVSSADSRVATPAGRFDKLGRRIFSPPLSRTNSFTPSTSIPSTPRKEEIDGDIDRASTLLSLYEIRAKLKEQDNSSLQKAREKINALAAKQTQLAKEREQLNKNHISQQRDSTGSGRLAYPK